MSYLERPFRPAAERLLARAWGCPVLLDEGVTIGAAGEIKPNIRRCRVIEGPEDGPPTVIVKRILGPGEYHPDDVRLMAEFNGMPTLAWQLFREWAGTQFLSRLPVDLPLSPRCYGGDRDEGLVVLEDLGSGPTVGERLQGDDPARAEEAVLGYATSLGRMHAATIGREEEYERVWNALGTRTGARVRHDQAKHWRRFREVGDQLGIRFPSGFEREREVIVGAMQAPGPFLAFGHGENNPVNTLCLRGQVRLLDFEFSGWRHALTDGVNYRHLFPWRTHRLPDELLRRMEAAYRAALMLGCPEAADEVQFGRAFVAARAHWTVCTACEHLFGDFGENAALENDGYWEGDLSSAEQAAKPSIRERVLILLDNLAGTTEEFGQMEATGAGASDLAARLRSLWRPREYRLPLYPAFQGQDRARAAANQTV